MCEPVSLAAATLAVTAGSAVASYSAQQSAAKKQGAYNATVEAQQGQYRLDTMAYQTQQWAQDIAHTNDLLSWSANEWDRQVVADGKAREAIEKNTLAGVGQVLLRQVEEDMLTIMRGQDARRTGATERASRAARAADRGVEGNSVEAIIRDVTRQEGEAIAVMAMNRSASIRALNREAVAVDAQGDQQLGALALRTYAPSATIRAPAPVSAVNPSAPVQGGNVGQLISGVVGGVTGAVTNYSQWAGQPVKDTLGQMQGWVSRQFRV